MGQIKSLKNVNLKISYDPCKDDSDLINELYIPCLSNSIRYDRIAAYFNSAVLQYYSAGLVELYKNGGHARFIFSSETNEIDLERISEAYQEKMDEMSEEFENTELIDDYNIANLSYLIKHNLAEIKIAFMLNGKTSIMHIKQAVFEDSFGNIVHISGSGNETPHGLKENAEKIYVFNNFGLGDNYTEEGEKTFNDLWNNTYSKNVYATNPAGLLFTKLCSYNRERMFNNQIEFDAYRFDNMVYIDIDTDESLIKVYDFTEDKVLSYPNGIRSPYSGRISNPEENVYFIKGLTLHDIRDVIPNRVTMLSEKYSYSQRAQKYIEEQNLYLDKRVELATAIKHRDMKERWEDNYNHFKRIINDNTIIPLKEEQLLNAYHHYIMRSSMDFSVPGTGKTYISYGLFSFLNSNDEDKPEVDHIVIFGPLACFKAWTDENKSLFGEKYTIFDISKFSKRNAVTELRKNKYYIYLFNYESLIESNNELMKTISNFVLDQKTLVVFDEIHRIKRVDGGKWSQNVINIMHEAKHKPRYKLALTGTPLPNSYVDLYNYIKILYEDDLDGFLKNFSVGELHLADTNDVVAKEIKDNLYPLYTRTTKNDLKIPLPNDDNLDALTIQPTENEEELYKYVYKSYQGSKGFVRLIRLIQATSNPRLLLKSINKEELEEIDAEDSNIEYSEEDFNESDLYKDEIKHLVDNIGMASKTIAAIDLIEKKVKEGKKVIVWCLFIDTIDLVVSELIKRGLNAESVTGRDTANLDSRNDKIEQFKNGEVAVLVTNPNTLAESISLHMTCHDAVYIEYGYNLTYMLQSKDRIHRVGLPEGTETNYYYAMSNSINPLGQIDLKIYERLKMKEERMKDAVESNDIIFVKDENTEDDIDFILNSLS